MLAKKFTLEDLAHSMRNSKNIRNLSVIAHVDHGKSTLTDTLLFAAGLIQDVSGERATDTRPDEQARGVTIKSTGVTLQFTVPEGLVLPESPSNNNNTNAPQKQQQHDDNSVIINLIDCPGHVDFSAEVSAALRLTDGAYLLTDFVEGVCVQTETVLRQALLERVRPALVINKVDRGFVELNMDYERMYQHLAQLIQTVNNNIAMYPDEALGSCEVDPMRGNVAFTSAKQGWGITLPQFSRMLAKKTGIESQRWLRRLWGDSFYDEETNKWVSHNVSQTTGKPLVRGFVKLVLKPIGDLQKEISDPQAHNTTLRDIIENKLPKIGVHLSNEEKQLVGKELLQTVMSRWLPCAEALVELAIMHLPSPVVAQRYRVENLYTGPMDDVTARAVAACDPDGPIVMYVSKMVPTKDNSRFLAFGRVFSGTVTAGSRVTLMGNNYEPEHINKTDYFPDIKLQRIAIMNVSKLQSADAVPCGNTCAIVGIDNYLTKSGTLTNIPDAFPFRNMKLAVSAVVRVAVQPVNATDIKKLVDALKRLVKTDQLVEVTVEPTGEHVIGCAGELHLEICLSDLRDFMNGAEITTSQPIVQFRETVLERSARDCLAKSPNNLNRMIMAAEPLSEEVVFALDNRKITSATQPKLISARLQEYGWDVAEARKIWAFGPEGRDPATNLLTDTSKSVPYLHDIKDSVVAAFQWVSAHGVLAEEPLRGVKYRVLDAKIHSDAAHRGGGQLIPASRRAMYASQLSSKARLVEPVYLVEIQTTDTAVSGVYNVINQRRGTVLEVVPTSSKLVNVKCHLAVRESFGLTEQLRQQTSGRAFPQSVFSHWSVIDEDPLIADSDIGKLVRSIRTRKGLEVDIPPFERYFDKI